MWSAIANFFKWLFVPDATWLAQQLAEMNAIAEEKLGLFFWLYNTLRNFFACFSNLQDYTGFPVHVPNGTTTVLFYGDIWTMVMRYVNPLLTGMFVIMFCVFCFRRVTVMFKQ